MPVTALVLFAALLHASWNALLRGGADRLWSMAIMAATSTAACLLLVPFLPLPARASWPYLLATGLLQIGYGLFLVRTYRSGDLGQTYPIARGSSPVLVTIGAALFAGELPHARAIVGVALISAGIVSLAFERRRVDRDSLPYALATGAFIGAYSVTDGIGVRLSGQPIAYVLWMQMLPGIALPLICAQRRGWRSLRRGRRETGQAIAGGLLSTIGYGIVILAMSHGPMGSISALRETSVVFAALIGAIFLGERLTLYRIAACGVIAAGALCIAH